MSLQDADVVRLQQALGLAAQAIGLSDPNPRVGCVVAAADGAVLGIGSTQEAGAAHAEAMALRAAGGRSLAGATAWVTLEPCSHHGRTPPCCDALLAAGIARVAVATVDPNPLVAGKGMARLRAAGVEVALADPASALAVAARELNIGFFSRMLRARPWVRMKIAASLDGRTALLNGSSQWITGLAARADGHAWRRRAGAVLTGIGTVLADDPRLDVRLVDTARQPLRAVVDSHLSTPPTARLLDAPGAALIYTATPGAQRSAALEARGAKIEALAGPDGKVDLAAMLADLARRGVNELHVEAGPRLNAALLRAGLVDELLVYLAPKLLGIGREMAAFGPLADLAEASAFEFTDLARIGPDLRLLARPPGRADFLTSLP